MKTNADKEYSSYGKQALQSLIDNPHCKCPVHLRDHRILDLVYWIEAWVRRETETKRLIYSERAPSEIIEQIKFVFSREGKISFSNRRNDYEF